MVALAATHTRRNNVYTAWCVQSYANATRIYEHTNNTHALTRTHIHTHALHAHTYIHMHLHAHTYIHTHTHIHSHTCTLIAVIISTMI